MAGTAARGVACAGERDYSRGFTLSDSGRRVKRRFRLDRANRIVLLMFTGLVESLGRIAAVIPEPPGIRLAVEAAAIAQDAVLGESICVNGCCLSVVRIDGPRLEFQLGPETLVCTTLGRLVPNASVNLERSMRPTDRLGGHLLTGHVDGVGRLESRVQEGDWVKCWFSAAQALLLQMAPKGSVAIDGVSLTVVDVSQTALGVAFIPHTLANTTLGLLEVEAPVNLETDLVFKYVARWLESREGSASVFKEQKK